MRRKFLQVLKERMGAAMAGPRSRAHLIRKVITNRRGHKQTVYVKPDKSGSPPSAPQKQSQALSPVAEARKEFQRADAEFSAALEEAYGKQAGDKRYSPGPHPPAVEAAKRKRMEAQKKWHAAQEQARASGKDPLSGAPVESEQSEAFNKEKPEPTEGKDRTASDSPATALSFVGHDQIRELSQYTDKRNYDRKTIDGIKASILRNGYNPAFPLQVDTDNGTYNIVSGHHRFTAVKELISEGKLPDNFQIPVIVKQYGSKGDRLMAQMSENVRRTVNPLDEARAIGELTEMGHSVSEIAEKTGMNPGTVRRRKALTGLHSDLQKLIEKKDRSLPVGIAEAIGTHGLNPDGSKNATIQNKAHRFYNANRHRGFGAAEVISYMQELKSQNSDQIWSVDETRTEAEKQAVQSLGSEEKAKRNTAQIDKFLNNVQSSFQRLLGDSVGSLNESTLKELSNSLVATEGESGFRSKMDQLSALMNDLETVKRTLEQNFNKIKEESSNHSLAFARSMAVIEASQDAIHVLKSAHRKTRVIDKTRFLEVLKAKGKSARNRAHLVRKVITNKKGHKQTVYVNPNETNQAQAEQIGEFTLKRRGKFIDVLGNLFKESGLYMALNSLTDKKGKPIEGENDQGSIGATYPYLVTNYKKIREQLLGVARGPADNREQDLSPADVRNIPDEIESEVKGDKARSLWKRASERFPNLDAGTFVDHLVEYLLHRDKYEDLFSQQSLFQEPSETPANSAKDSGSKGTVSTPNPAPFRKDLLRFIHEQWSESIQSDPRSIEKAEERYNAAERDLEESAREAYGNRSSDMLEYANSRVHPPEVQEDLDQRNEARVSLLETRKESQIRESRIRASVETGKARVGVKTQHAINEEVRQILKSVPPEKMTEEQKELLRQYEGWGGQTRNDKTDYSGKGLLYEFYTPEKVVNKSWELLERYIPKGSKILEPAAGTGRFAEGRPDYSFDMLEVDDTSSQIAGILHPDASVRKGQFEELFLDNRNRSKKQYDGPLYDAVVTNPPYGEMGGKYKASEGRGWQRYEEYFLHRSLDTVKEGGIVAMVVPSNFLRKGKTKAKEKIFNKAELLEAHRLPNGAFAHTDIGTDLIILRKNTTEHKDNAIAFGDEYFKRNPNHLHGEEHETTDRWGKPDLRTKGNIDTFLNHRPAAPKEISKAHKDAISRGLIGNQNAKGKHKVASSNRKTVKKKAVRNATRKTKNTAREKQSPPPKLLNQAEFNKKYGLNFSELDVELLKSTNALGYIDPQTPFDPKSMSFHNGGAMPDYLYATGDIYEKLKQLESDREEIIEKGGLQLYQKQRQMLEEAIPEQTPLKDVVLDPIDPFFKTVTLDDGSSLLDRFKEWVGDLDYETFMDYAASASDVRAYCDAIPVRGNNKSLNERIRRERRELAMKLADRFVKESLGEAEQNQIQQAWNERFNAYVQVDPAKVPIPIEGLNEKFKGKDYELRDVQHRFIANFLSKGIGCAAHEVGLGKTMTGIIATVSNMQMGRSKRPLFVVPTSVLPNWEASVKSLYPNLTVNTIGTPELNQMTQGGKQLEIEEGSVTVMSYDAFQRMGFTEERFNELTKDLQDAHATYSDDPKNKRAKAAKENQAEAFASRAKTGTYNDILFDEAGFDSLTVDEAHNFNNIFADVKQEKDPETGKVKTQANEFSGIIGGATSDRGLKMWLAAQHVLKSNDNRNVMMLTATPFTNNPLQVYSLLSTMARERLQKMGIYNVKDFVAAFVETQTEKVLEPNGKIKEKQTVRRFKNAHAFASLINEFFDRKTGEDAHIKRPDLVEKEIVLPSNKEMDQIRQSLENYYDMAFHPDPEERDPSAALRSMTMQQNLNISPALVNDYQFNDNRQDFVERSPKMKFVAKSAAEYYKRMKEAQGNAPGQIIFLPRGVEYFNEVKSYMVSQGIPEDAIEIMTPKEKGKKARSKEAKAKGQSRFEEIKFDFNDPNGKTKIIIGSDTIQEGVSLQKNTGVMYNCSLAWNPTSNEQKKGRGWRQGNTQERCHMFYPVMENSIDTKLYQKHAEKVSRINDIFKATGSPFIETTDINPDELKYEIVTDPEKKARLVASEDETQRLAAIKDKTTDRNILLSTLNRAENLDRRIRDAEESLKRSQRWAEMYGKNSTLGRFHAEDANRIKSKLSRLKRDKVEHETMMEQKGLTVEKLRSQAEALEKEIAQMKADSSKKKEELESELVERYRREKEEYEKSRPNKSIDQMVDEHVSKLVDSSLGKSVYKSRIYRLIREGRTHERRHQAAAL